jgi:DNA-directed RNA polymerase subunit RPC12/RpoP
MPDFVTLTCPKCGGKLQITPDLDRFACAHCGNEHLVKRAQGVVALQPLTESLGGLRRATDRTASEMALRRLADELADLKEARARAERRIEECQQALRDRDRARRELIKSAVTLPLAFFLSLLWPLPLQLGGVIGSLAEAEGDDLVVWLVLPAVMAVITVATIRRRLAAPALRTPREQREGDLAAALERLRVVDDSVSRVHAEREQHRGRVVLHD